MMDETDLAAATEPTIDDIIAELDRDHRGKLPEDALRAAQRRREEITPRLIDLIQTATRAARSGEFPDSDGHLLALFLLTEFQASQALPAIIEAISLPGDGSYELFGDVITETLPSVLAELAGDSPELVDELISNQSLNDSVRWSAAHTYLLYVRDGRLTREQAVERLREHLQEATAKREGEFAGMLVIELLNYAPREALDAIQEAFRRNLVDPSFIHLSEVEDGISRGEPYFQESLDYCRPTGVKDTVEELRGWAHFRDRSGDSDAWEADSLEEDWDDPHEFQDDGYWDSEPARPAITIHRDAPRVGRNDPCPCGSGRKYKKCCGAGV